MAALNGTDLRGIRAVLFDWGGTLVTVAGEEAIWRRCVEAALDAGRAGGLPLSREHFYSFIDRYIQVRRRAEDDPDHREIALEHELGLWIAELGMHEHEPALLERMLAAYFDQWIGCLRLFDGVSESLGALRTNGYRLGLVSNVIVPPAWCRRELDRLGIAECFEALTFSSEVGRRKPHAAMFHDALRKLGCHLGDGAPTAQTTVGDGLAAREILFVGDSPQADVRGAQAVGMRAALVRDRENRWPAAAFNGVQPDLVVEQASDIVNLLPPLAKRSAVRSVP